MHKFKHNIILYNQWPRKMSFFLITLSHLPKSQNKLDVSSSPRVKRCVGDEKVSLKSKFEGALVRFIDRFECHKQAYIQYYFYDIDCIWGYIHLKYTQQLGFILLLLNEKDI
jgi:hypothetical protein